MIEMLFDVLIHFIEREWTMDIEIKENTIIWKRNRYIHHNFGNTECFVRVFLITVFYIFSMLKCFQILNRD